MKLHLIAFTRRGAALAERLAAALAAQGHETEARGLGAGAEVLPGAENLKSWTAAAFAAGDGLIFVGACGIAVRAIAPHVRDKFTDPAVVAVDEAGRFAVPLLSGHVGGANALAEAVAAITGGQAAVSTATDVNGIFAVDVWAREHGLAITDRSLAKAVSAALLRGEKVGYAGDFPLDCPEGLYPGKAALGVWVTCRSGGGPFPETLRLVPRCLSLGIGCRRGTPEAAIRAAVEAALPGWDLAAVGQVATIDLKADEPGLLAFCEELGLPLRTYTAAELAEAEGAFTPSEFVRSVTGVDNVCERAAVRSGGRLAVPKRAAGGVTVAAAVLPGFWEMQ